jgi:multiple sugar transport system permease protein
MTADRAAPIRPDTSLEVAPVGDRGKVWRRRIAYAFLIGYALLMFVPFTWMIITSFKTLPDSVRMTFIPDPFTLQGWEFAFTRMNPAIPRLFMSSAIIAATVTVTNVVMGSMAGYAFARLRFPGREALFLLVLGTMMIPDQLRLVPIYNIMRTVGLTAPGPQQYLSVILVLAIAAVSIFLLRQYFLSIPRDLEEAAKIDGAGFFTTFWRVMLPLATPAIAAVSILQFQGAWNGFFWPLVLLSRENWTLPLGLALFRIEFTVNYPPLMAMSVIATLPILIIYIFFQRFFVEGIAASGVKG